MAATIEDRAITIALQRRTKAENVERLRHADMGAFVTLARKIERWAVDNMEAFSKLRPVMPDALGDRAQDNWEHPFAIAELTGGGWLAKTKEAALAICGKADEQADQSALLEDIKAILEAERLIDAAGEVSDPMAHKGRDRPKEEFGIASTTLLALLVAMDERQWGECNHGRPLTQNGLARKLRPYGLATKKLREGDGTLMGYRTDDLMKVMDRYLAQTGQIGQKQADSENIRFETHRGPPNRRINPEQTQRPMKPTRSIFQTGTNSLSEEPTGTNYPYDSVGVTKMIRSEKGQKGGHACIWNKFRF